MNLKLFPIHFHSSSSYCRSLISINLTENYLESLNIIKKINHSYNLKPWHIFSYSLISIFVEVMFQFLPANTSLLEFFTIVIEQTIKILYLEC